jgi:hypothetical protein
MKIDFTILMPFSRPQNAEALWTAFNQARGETYLNLVAICGDKTHTTHFRDPLLIHTPPGVNICYWKLNRAIEQFQNPTQRPRINHFYGFVCDDDTYCENFFPLLAQKISESADAGFLPEVVVVNMKRWHHLSAPQDELGANPQNMVPGRVGLEQFFIRADVLSNCRFKETIEHADGDMVERLHASRPSEFLFVTHPFVNWNNLPA